MKQMLLKRHTDGEVIFSGTYTSQKECLEDAVKKEIDLSYVDLQSSDLSNANLDGAHMPGTYFSGANLTGANLSEATLAHGIFYNCALYNTCLSYSDLRHSDFRGANFGGTMIEGSNLKASTFSTLSSLDLDFTQTKDMSACSFSTPDGLFHRMSRPPIVLKGMFNAPIIIMDETVKIGMQTFCKNVMPPLFKMISLYMQASLCSEMQKFIETQGKCHV